MEIYKGRKRERGGERQGERGTQLILLCENVIYLSLVYLCDFSLSGPFISFKPILSFINLLRWCSKILV